MDINVQQLINLGTETLIKFGGKLVAALAIVVIGFWLAGKLTKGFKLILNKREIDPTLRPFLTGLVKTVLQILVIISAIGVLGIEATSFVAILGSAGIAFGMALSGTLQNFAGGVVLLVLKPFKVGDFIEAQNYTGTVKAIQIFNTFLTTPDNKVIILPNGALSSNSIVNFTSETMRRVDITVGIAYGDSYDTAKKVIMDLIDAEPRILGDPAPFVGLLTLADSSVNLVLRAWTKPEDYWDVYFELNENIYKTIPQKGLHFPYPQMDIHIKTKN
jgi:small conductance mechanosensitive channel